MIVLGLVLLVLCLAVGAVIALTNTDPVSAEALGYSLGDLSAGGLFLLGALVGALAMLGLALMAVGAARKRVKRRAARHEVRSARGEAETLAEQNARLQAELEQRDAGTYPADPVAPTPGRGKHVR
jgi:uncharacterized integral membrane protein